MGQLELLAKSRSLPPSTIARGLILTAVTPPATAVPPAWVTTLTYNTPADEEGLWI